MRAGFLLAVLFLAGFYSAVAFLDLSYLSSAGRLGPGFFPRIIGVGLVLLCLYSLYADRKRAEVDDPVSPHWRVAAVVALLSAAFVALLNVLGGFLSMVVFMAAALHFLNRGRALQNALIAVLLPVSVVLLFDVWLNASMPRGMIPLPF
jgi:hypothetical protein